MNRIGNRYMTEQARFDAHVMPEPNSGCWLWFGAGSPRYGQFKAGEGRMLAHRYSYEKHVGKIPDGLLVCHKCDTPSCVNPSHLFLGTHQDNSSDMVRKARKTNGEAIHSAKLSTVSVAAIRRSMLDDTELATIYGVSITAVNCARHGRTWRNVAMPDLKVEKKSGRKFREACFRGHPFDKENIFINANGARECRVCRKIHADKRKAKC